MAVIPVFVDHTSCRNLKTKLLTPVEYICSESRILFLLWTWQKSRVRGSFEKSGSEMFVPIERMGMLPGTTTKFAGENHRIFLCFLIFFGPLKNNCWKQMASYTHAGITELWASIPPVELSKLSQVGFVEGIHWQQIALWPHFQILFCVPFVRKTELEVILWWCLKWREKRKKKKWNVKVHSNALYAVVFVEITLVCCSEICKRVSPSAVHETASILSSHDAGCSCLPKEKRFQIFFSRNRKGQTLFGVNSSRSRTWTETHAKRHKLAFFLTFSLVGVGNGIALLAQWQFKLGDGRWVVAKKRKKKKKRNK